MDRIIGNSGQSSYVLLPFEVDYSWLDPALLPLLSLDDFK
jgi:hypothetical protein